MKIISLSLLSCALFTNLHCSKDSRDSVKAHSATNRQRCPEFALPCCILSYCTGVGFVGGAALTYYVIGAKQLWCLGSVVGGFGCEMGAMLSYYECGTPPDTTVPLTPNPPPPVITMSSIQNPLKKPSL